MKTLEQRKKAQLSVFDRNQLSIAFKTVNMPDALVAVLPGPTKDEAKATILKLTGRYV